MSVLKTNPQGSVKKPYQRPVLTVYGDVRTMTATVHMGTMTDAIAMMASKTN